MLSNNLTVYIYKIAKINICQNSWSMIDLINSDEKWQSLGQIQLLLKFLPKTNTIVVDDVIALGPVSLLNSH